MNTTDTTYSRMESELKALRAEVERLKARAAQNDARRAMKLDRYIDTLSDRSDEVGEKIESLKEAGDDAMDDIKSGLQDAWDRLAIAKQAAQARFH